MFFQKGNIGKCIGGGVTPNDILIFVYIYTKSVIGVCIVVLLPLSLLLFSSAIVPNRLMRIICAHPPVCVVHTHASTLHQWRRRGESGDL